MNRYKKRPEKVWEVRVKRSPLAPPPVSRVKAAPIQSYRVVNTNMLSGHLVQQDGFEQPAIVYPTREVLWTNTEDKYPQRQPLYSKGIRFRNPPPLAYSVSKTRREAVNGTKRETAMGMQNIGGNFYGPYLYTRNDQVGVFYWPFEEPPNYSITEIVARARARAVTALLLKIKNQQFNGAQALAEAAQTQRMVGSAVHSIASTFTSLRRGDLRAAANGLGLTVGKRQATAYRKRHASAKSKDDIDQMLANGVLTVQYGIKPLVNDVVGAMTMLADKLLVDDSIRSKVRKTEDLDDTWSYSEGSWNKSRIVTGYVSVNIGVQYRSTGLNELSRTAAQLGLTNPALLAWELLPWSFVIDWFIPIGDAIAQFDATVGVNFLNGYLGTRISLREDRFYAVALAKNPLGGSTVGSAHGSYTSDSFDRSVIHDFPTPAMPQFKNPFSPQHLLNGLALLAGFKKNVYR